MAYGKTQMRSMNTTTLKGCCLQLRELIHNPKHTRRACELAVVRIVICTVNREVTMSRTGHHKNQKHQHDEFDYGGKYKNNKHYGGGYGVDGRDAADKERRETGKELCESGVDELAEMEVEELLLSEPHDLGW